MTDLRELARELRESEVILHGLVDAYDEGVEVAWKPADCWRALAKARAAVAVLERLGAEQEAAQASLLRIRSHADWLVGFLGAPGPGCETFRECAHRKAQELLAEITAAQAASSEPGPGGVEGSVGQSADAARGGIGDPEQEVGLTGSGSLGAEADAAAVRRTILRFAAHATKRDPSGATYREREDALAALDRLLAGKAAG